jgi:electron transfer flavoprotein beta subunit
MLPQVAFVKKIEKVEKRSITVHRMTEEGHDIVQVPLPALITVVKEINLPRYSSLAGKVRARRMDVCVWGPNDIHCDVQRLGLEGSPTWVQRIFAPPVRKGTVPLAATDENILKVVEAICPSKS